MVGVSGRVRNGVFYVVESVDETGVVLVGGITVPAEAVAKQLRLTHALTLAGCQGLTLRGRVRVLTDSPHFSLRNLYVACSRATSHELLEVR